ncbi:hypothetical protein [Oculatella sp. LEGE 06141]|nr:hypothetical protein [Oculatella sp. LEGE 06141]
MSFTESIFASVTSQRAFSRSRSIPFVAAIRQIVTAKTIQG